MSFHKANKPTFRVWFPNDRETLTDARSIQAYDAYQAAERAVEDVYNDGNTEWGWYPMTAMVLDAAGVQQTFKVSLEYEPTFDAELITPS